jgi:site-specific DNA-cytosine methylase
MTGGTIFSGGGGADLGMSAAGIDVLWGVEYDDDIASVARANELPVQTADVRDVDIGSLEPVDCLHASPPCPSFSTAKSDRKEEAEDVEVAKATCNFIRELQPKIFTLENVWGYRISQSWALIQKVLKDEGYGWNAWHINTADYGVPQTRRRMFVAAVRGGLRPTKPPQTHAEEPPQGGLFASTLKPWVGWLEAIQDLIPLLPDSEFADWQKKRLPIDVVAVTEAIQSTCKKRAVVCAIVDKDDNLLSVSANRCEPEGVCERLDTVSSEDEYPKECSCNWTHAEMGAISQLKEDDEPHKAMVWGHEFICGHCKNELHSRGIEEFEVRDWPWEWLTGAEATLVSNAGSKPSGHPDRAPQTYSPDDPSLPVTPQHNGRLRAVLIDDKNTAPSKSGRREDRTLAAYDGNSPSRTVRATQYMGIGRAILIDGQNTNPSASGRREDRTLAVRQAGQPMNTVQATQYKGMGRALLVGNSANETSGAPIFKPDCDPAYTVRVSTGGHNLRAYIACRVVQMTPRALARFQTFPDTYDLPDSKSLACRIIGNAVPCLFMQQLYEHLLYQSSDVLETEVTT